MSRKKAKGRKQKGNSPLQGSPASAGRGVATGFTTPEHTEEARRLNEQGYQYFSMQHNGAVFIKRLQGNLHQAVILNGGRTLKYKPEPL